MLILMTVGLVGLMIMGMPVAIALCVTATVGYYVNVGPEVFFDTSAAVSQKMYYSLSNFLLLSIPFFILAAKIMNSAGITTRLFSFANMCTGFMPGGLAHANILNSLIFSGMSGTAVADVVGPGQIEYRAMIDNGYQKEFSAGITAASAIIGPITPPSVPMVIYSLVSGASVGQLFIGGIIPGLMLTAALMIMIYFMSFTKVDSKYKWPTVREALKACWDVAPPLMTPVILLVGIWGGYFTPSEAAVVAFAFAMLLSVLYYRESGLRSLMEVFIETGKETATIGFITCSAAFYAWVLARSGVTSQLGAFLSSFTTDPVWMILILNIFLLIAGAFMEPVGAILILGPILVSIASKVGIDLVHFGVVMVLNLMIGLCTPPFGVILFIMQKFTKLSFTQVLRGTTPFLIPIFVVLFLISVFPDLVLYLPRIFL